LQQSYAEAIKLYPRHREQLAGGAVHGKRPAAQLGDQQGGVSDSRGGRTETAAGERRSAAAQAAPDMNSFA